MFRSFLFDQFYKHIFKVFEVEIFLTISNLIVASNEWKLCYAIEREVKQVKHTQLRGL